jgi:hypothetical protein
MYEQCGKRNIVFRQGRNKRMYAKQVRQNTFNDVFWWGHEQEVFFSSVTNEQYPRGYFKLDKKT